PPYPTSGTDQVYGLNVARLLADEDRPDQLVLSLYGQLAAAMTERTFVAGEGATVAPLRGESYRSMYLPPNGAANASFLETLRLRLPHGTRIASLSLGGRPYARFDRSTGTIVLPVASGSLELVARTVRG